MSDEDPGAPAGSPPGEPFLDRWSRLKTQARARDPDLASARDPGVPEEPPSPRPAAPAVPAPDTPPPAAELPDLDQLHQDSDYSPFLAPGVDAALRQRALRKLFHSPKFNVFDGLDTYRDDFRNFTALGGIVTADMKHHLERLAQQVAKATEDVTPDPAPPATQAAKPLEADPESPAALPSARTDDDTHDEPA